MPALATCACLTAEWHKVTSEIQLRTAELVARAKVFLVATYHLLPTTAVTWGVSKFCTPGQHQK